MPSELEKQFSKLQKKLARVKTDKAGMKAKIEHAAYVSAIPLRDVIRTSMPVRTGLARKQLKIKYRSNRRGMGAVVTVAATAAQKKKSKDAFYIRFVFLGTKRIKSNNVIKEVSQGPHGAKAQQDFAKRIATIINGA